MTVQNTDSLAQLHFVNKNLQTKNIALEITRLEALLRITVGSCCYLKNELIMN